MSNEIQVSAEAGLNLYFIIRRADGEVWYPGGNSTPATITGISKASAVELRVTTSGAHGFSTADEIAFSGIAGMIELNDKFYTVTVIDATNFDIDGTDGDDFTAYVSDGTAKPQPWEVYGTGARDADDYDIALTDKEVGLYVGNFDANLVIEGEYIIMAYKRLGASPADTDLLLGVDTILWYGNQEYSNISWARAGARLGHNATEDGSDGTLVVRNLADDDDLFTTTYAVNSETGNIVRGIKKSA